MKNQTASHIFFKIFESEQITSVGVIIDIFSDDTLTNDKSFN